MKRSEIKFTVELDDKNIPEKIFWDATDNPNEGLEETKAITISLWDHFHFNTLKIDLWTKDMPVGDMKRFYIETIAGMADALRTATGDEKMTEEIHTVCRKLFKHLEEEIKKEQEKL
ncbi:gliding motility protein GldC [Rhodocytophaga aerolata]|uniref:Gliding motility protein GldC n=1 Tax=Rhodocytophaga aerolata TaxID=455078 RepID=A0ABT8R288_9BACT|nr:gliding motility protein GldC [Rhodocytophaga aerolata]MDO1446205.1 gliding motility protein GldC [Rhodocytophaga aerolata]